MGLTTSYDIEHIQRWRWEKGKFFGIGLGCDVYGRLYRQTSFHNTLVEVTHILSVNSGAKVSQLRNSTAPTSGSKVKLWGTSTSHVVYPIFLPISNPWIYEAGYHEPHKEHISAGRLRGLGNARSTVQLTYNGDNVSVRRMKNKTQIRRTQ